MKIIKELSILLFICFISNLLASVLGIPTSLIAMFLMFLLLVFNLLKIEYLKTTTDFLLNNMSLFFIPVSVGVVESFIGLRGSIIKLLVVCVLSTLITFSATMFVLNTIVKAIEKRK